jgi:hypothetical protein
MSKVIHVSDAAHEQAKTFCKDRNLSMSDWVAELISKAAQTNGSASTPPTSKQHKTSVVKKKRLEQDLPAVVEAEDLPAYASPPFWDDRQGPRA